MLCEKTWTRPKWAVKRETAAVGSHLDDLGVGDVTPVGQHRFDGGRSQDSIHDIQTTVFSLDCRLQHRHSVHHNLTLIDTKRKQTKLFLLVSFISLFSIMWSKLVPILIINLLTSSFGAWAFRWHHNKVIPVLDYSPDPGLVFEVQQSELDFVMMNLQYKTNCCCNDVLLHIKF